MKEHPKMALAKTKDGKNILQIAAQYNRMDTLAELKSFQS
jgi:hypothetical protein